MEQFQCEFEMHGAKYACIIEAENVEDAEDRVAAMRESLTLLGWHGGSIPAHDEPIPRPRLFDET